MGVELSGRRVVLGVTGCIAAYKACDLLRALIRAGAIVRVVLTQHGAEFVSGTTFRSLGAQRVITMMFPREVPAELEHISTAEWAELLIIAPATANVIAKAALGVADDFLSTLSLACPAPLVVAPAMNDVMFAHDATQSNIETLVKRGAVIVEPGTGTLASGKVGQGRLAEIDDILEACATALGGKSDLSNVRVLVTSGPTVEPIDAVRVITNRSSGRMGHAIALAAASRGADVVLVSGPVELPDPPGVKTVRVETADQMHKAVRSHLRGTDVFIAAAAVADFAPASPSRGKAPKGKKGTTLKLKPTVDILSEVGGRKKRPVVVGFALQAGRSLEPAREKMRKKNCDLMVVNSLSDRGAGPSVETNRVTVLRPDAKPEKLPLLPKAKVAHEILDRVASVLGK
jgi:phosphopantothenoylcysteine decarboxylase/phosphopantothenate--cysteine ligase